MTSPSNSKQTTALPVANDCFGCGVCCLHMGYPAFMLTQKTAAAGIGNVDVQENLTDDQYWNRMPTQLREELESVMANYSKGDSVLDGPCVWLDQNTMQCRHHEYRPRVCRDFKIGSRGCRQWREHYRQRILNTSKPAATDHDHE